MWAKEALQEWFPRWSPAVGKAVAKQFPAGANESRGVGGGQMRLAVLTVTPKSGGGLTLPHFRHKLAGGPRCVPKHRLSWTKSQHQRSSAISDREDSCGYRLCASS